MPMATRPSTPPSPPGGGGSSVQRRQDDRREQQSYLPPWASRFLQRTPRIYRWPAAVLIGLGCTAYFVWDALPDQTGHLMLTGAWGRVSSWAWSPNRVGYYPGVAVDHEQIVIDFSEWVAPRSTNDFECCKTTWQHTLEVRRLDDEANHVAKRVSTTGGEPEISRSSHDLVDLLPVPGQRTGGPNMTRYNAIFDISAEDLRRTFRFEFTTVRLGGFSDVQSEWAAVPIVQPTRRVVLKLQFSSRKPPASVQYSISDRTARDNYTVVDDDASRGERVEDTVVEWTIDHPRLGYAYRVDWTW